MLPVVAACSGTGRRRPAPDSLRAPRQRLRAAPRRTRPDCHASCVPICAARGRSGMLLGGHGGLLLVQGPARDIGAPGACKTAQHDARLSGRSSSRRWLCPLPGSRHPRVRDPGPLRRSPRAPAPRRCTRPCITPRGLSGPPPPAFGGTSRAARQPPRGETIAFSDVEHAPDLTAAEEGVWLRGCERARRVSPLLLVPCRV